MAYSSIVKPTDYFNTVLYTGDGSTSNAITGVGFQPDFLWIKGRDETYNHNLFDAIRGSKYWLGSNTNSAEDTGTAYPNSFDSDGFTLNSGGSTNASSDTYVAWNWLASGSTASNSDGSITSTVSANTTAGFSIVTYTGTGSAASVGHGLGVKPDMIISKIRSTTGDWNVYHDSFAAQERIKLNSTAAKSTNASIFASLPTSSVVNIGTGGDINTSSGTHLFYCFAEKKGYSKIGSYTGNGNADGPFVYTGFKPAWVLVKTTTDAGYNWVMYDNKRVGFNPDNDTLTANETRVEQTTGFGHIDMLSNGFKVRASTNDTNRNANVFIYMAFAENPFVANDSGTAVPVVAR